VAALQRDQGRPRPGQPLIMSLAHPRPPRFATASPSMEVAPRTLASEARVTAAYAGRVTLRMVVRFTMDTASRRGRSRSAESNRSDRRPASPDQPCRQPPR